MGTGGAARPAACEYLDLELVRGEELYVPSDCTL
jgi:hypothetical protein